MALMKSQVNKKDWALSWNLVLRETIFSGKKNWSRSQVLEKIVGENIYENMSYIKDCIVT
jgi:hypothetical protein